MLQKAKKALRKYPFLEGIAYLVYNNLFPFLNFSGTTLKGKNLEQSVKYIDDIARKYRECLQNAGTSLEGKTILEIGPGDNYGVGLRFLGWGAKRYIAVERFKPIDYQSKLGAVYKGLLELMSQEEKSRVASVIDESFAIDTKAESFRVYDSVSFECAHEILEEKVADIIVSNAVLEHVADLSRTIESISKLIKPGGISFHEVDLRSHERFDSRSPMHFLTIPEALWQMMGGRIGAPNRLRVVHYLREFGKHGLVLIEQEVLEKFSNEDISKVYGKIYDPLTPLSPEDLKPAVVRFTLVKPSTPKLNRYH